MNPVLSANHSGRISCSDRVRRGHVPVDSLGEDLEQHNNF